MDIIMNDMFTVSDDTSRRCSCAFTDRWSRLKHECTGFGMHIPFIVIAYDVHVHI